MILAMTKLQQSVRPHLSVTTTGGTIQANSLGREIVDPEQMPTQVRFKIIPKLISSQIIQHRGQAIVTPVQRSCMLIQTALQDRHVFPGPRLHMVQLVISFREDMAEPA